MFHVIIAPRALRQAKRLHAHDRAKIDEAMLLHLTHQPTKESRTRIKRLRQPAPCDYRLRVDDFRVFYNVDPKEQAVHVLAILDKDESIRWLTKGN